MVRKSFIRPFIHSVFSWLESTFCIFVGDMITEIL